jgi:quinolinate synthase
MDDIIKYGYVNAPIDKNIDLVSEINRLKKEKNLVILGHFYQRPEIQEISDFVGDSLALAQKAEKSDAAIIVMAGVHFMAETVKLLNPEKKVIIPNLNAGCSLADSCPADKFEYFIKKYPGHTVISYVNTTNKVKALSDIICTSSNAAAIVNSLPGDEKIIFGPDKNLGTYINKITGRNMVLWPGACHVHKSFSVSRIIEIKKKNEDAKIIAHPECEPDVLVMADFIGSTSSLLNYTKVSDSKVFIVATETGILHQMKKENPSKIFIAAPPDDVTCACNDCSFMKLITMENLYNSILYELPEIKIEEQLRIKALKPVRRMLDISEKLKI